MPTPLVVPAPDRAPSPALPPSTMPRTPPEPVRVQGEMAVGTPHEAAGAPKTTPLSDSAQGVAPLSEVGPFDRGVTEGRGGAQPPGAAAGAAEGARPGPVSPQQVAVQVAEAVRQAGPAGALEIALEPEDLGRVRLVFSAAEAGLAVTVQADRSETLEMLRRHIDLLLSDLRARGFEDVQIDFGGSMPGGQGEAAPEGGPAARPPADPATDPSASPSVERSDAAVPAGGLDLRL